MLQEFIFNVNVPTRVVSKPFYQRDFGFESSQLLQRSSGNYRGKTSKETYGNFAEMDMFNKAFLK